MKKKGVISIFCSLVILIFLGIYLNKPNEMDFVRWLETEYKLDCADYDCGIINIDGKKFAHSDGYYDSSTGFLATGMQIERLYRNVDEPNEFFSIEAKGFLGGFKEMEFRRNQVEIK